MPTLPNLGARIQAARKAKGLKQSELARSIGMAASSLSDIERGELDPKISQVLTLAEALDVELGWLVGLSETDINTEIERGNLSLETWHKYRALNYEFKGRVNDQIKFLFDIQEQLYPRKKDK